MASIMPSCVRFKGLRRRAGWGALLVLIPCLHAGLVQAQPEVRQLERFVVQQAGITLVSDVYVLNAKIDYHFSAEVLEALESGVPLTIELRLEIVRPRQWLWNEEFTSLEQRYLLQYHALSQQYLVKNLNSDTRYNFPTQQAAIDALGTISGLPVLDKRLLTPGEPYIARLRADLDINSLPIPMRLPAYLSAQWHLVSEWYTWPLRS